MFEIGDEVKIVGGVGEGKIGTIVENDNSTIPYAEAAEAAKVKYGYGEFDYCWKHPNLIKLVKKGNKMNPERIKQCKKDIEVLQKELEELQKEEVKHGDILEGGNGLKLVAIKWSVLAETLVKNCGYKVIGNIF